MVVLFYAQNNKETIRASCKVTQAAFFKMEKCEKNKMKNWSTIWLTVLILEL